MSHFLTLRLSPRVRDAANQAAVKLEAYSVQKEMREDVYHVVLAYKNKGETLDPDRQRFLDKLLESYQRNGLFLPPDKQKRLKEIKTRISELCIQFQQNLNEDTTTLKFTQSELEGMTEDFLSSLTRDGDKYIVTLKYPHIFPILQKCKVESTRRAVSIAKDSQQQAANTPLLEEILLLRQEEAKLLGYKNHAEYNLAIRMAKTPEKVLHFLTELNTKLEAPAKKEIATLLQLKEREKKERNEPFDGILHRSLSNKHFTHHHSHSRLLIFLHSTNFSECIHSSHFHFTVGTGVIIIRCS
jgi:thimet oligopeptidase